ncbi:MAG: hypothetical protein HYY40_09480 [Bacteroidetes bacterium]|nr:hypothetical protein [Bacteroidota bacterium]
MKRFFPIFSTLISILLFTCIFSCNRDKYDLSKLTGTEWNPDLAFPIAYSKLDLRDLLKDYDTSEVIVEDETGFLTIIYNDTIYSTRGMSLITIPSQNANESYGLTNAEIFNLLNLDSITVLYSDDYNFVTPPDQDSPPKNIELKTIIFSSGTVNFTFDNSFQHSGTVVITFPSVTSGTNTLTVSSGISASSVSTASVSLAGYTMDLTKGGTTVNTLPFSATVKLYDSGNPATSADSVRVTMSFQNLEFSYMDGYLGKWLLTLPKDSVDLNLEIFNTTSGGTTYFEDPRITIHIENSYGMPVKAIFTALQTTSQQGNQNINLNGVFPGPGITINYPAMTEVGQVKITDMQFDKTNSNLTDVLQAHPTYIVYEVNGELNPSGPPALNFITGSSYLSVGVEIELPLWGYAGIFTLMDTVDFTLDEVEDNVVEPDETGENIDVEYIRFRINCWNFFPMDADLQVYFADSSSPVKFKIIDSLNTTGQDFLLSGKLDANGKVSEATHTRSEVYVTDERVKKVAGANKMIIKAILSTPGYSPSPAKLVKIYADYYLLIKLGMRIKMRTTL